MNPFRFNALLAGVLMTLSAISVNAAHQAISPAGLYFGKVGISDILVSIGRIDAAAVYYMNRSIGEIEIATGAVNVGGVTTWASQKGTIFTFSRQGGIVAGTVGGVPFTAQPESPIGPFGRRAHGYSGTHTIQDLQLASPLLFSITASGKAMMVFFFSNLVQGGVGTISENGVVDLTLANGVRLNFLFQPKDGAATGVIVSPPGFYNVSYFLYQAQRAPLVNISTLGSVGGGHSLSAGFVTELAGKTFLIRAVGPRLLGFNVGDAHPNPTLAIYKNGALIASNDDWGANGDPALIAAAADQVGAFDFFPGSRDSALLVTLEPGAYSAQVTGAGDAGQAMVEVYEVR